MLLLLHERYLLASCEMTSDASPMRICEEDDGTVDRSHCGLSLCKKPND